MKNKILVFLAVMLLSVLLVPVAAFADDYEDFLKEGTVGEYGPEDSEEPAASYGGTVSASSDNGFTAVVQDDAGLFTEQERAQLLEQLKGLLEYGNMGIVTSEEPNSDSAQFSRQKYLELFGETDGLVFLIDMYNRRIQIFSGEQVYKVISMAKANEITDNIYTYATRGDYYKTASEAFDLIQIVLEGGRISTPMRYATNAALAVGLVLLINFIIVYTQRRKKAAANAPTNAIEYNVRNRQTSVVRGVRTIMTKQTKTRHTESSGGGGGFSGGGFSGGGGGGFSGGGGGHSF